MKKEVWVSQQVDTLLATLVQEAGVRHCHDSGCGCTCVCCCADCWQSSTCRAARGCCAPVCSPCPFNVLLSIDVLGAAFTVARCTPQRGGFMHAEKEELPAITQGLARRYAAMWKCFMSGQSEGDPSKVGL
jgi:hypothetical protein